MVYGSTKARTIAVEAVGQIFIDTKESELPQAPAVTNDSRAVQSIAKSTLLCNDLVISSR